MLHQAHELGFDITNAGVTVTVVGIAKKKKKRKREFTCGPVVRIPPFYCKGAWLRTMILYARLPNKSKSKPRNLKKGMDMAPRIIFSIL